MKNLLKNTTYLGSLSIDGKRLKFSRALNMARCNVIAMGDVVYFMCIKNKIHKIGIACGETGWESRVNMYSKGETEGGDATNRRIFKELREMCETNIDIYAVSAPRQKIVLTRPIKGDIIEHYVQTHRAVELSLTQQYIKSGGELRFCRQLN